MITIQIFLIFGFIFSSTITTATFICGYPAVDFDGTCIYFIDLRKNVEWQYFATATFQSARYECTKLRIHDLKWDLPKLDSESKLVKLIELTNAKEFNPPPEIDPMPNKMEGVDYWLGMRRRNDAPLDYNLEAMKEHNFYWIRDNSTVTLKIHGLDFWDEGEPDNFFARQVNQVYKENCAHVRVRKYVHMEPYGYRLAKFRDKPCSVPVNHTWHRSHHFIACESSSQPTRIPTTTTVPATSETTRRDANQTSETVRPPITTGVPQTSGPVFTSEADSASTQELRQPTKEPNSTPISESILSKWCIYVIFGITLICCVVAIVAAIAVSRRGKQRKKPAYTKLTPKRRRKKPKRKPNFGTIRDSYVKYPDDDDATPSPTPLRSSTTRSEFSRKSSFKSVPPKSVKKIAPTVCVIPDHDRSSSEKSVEYSNVQPRYQKLYKKMNVSIK